MPKKDYLNSITDELVSLSREIEVDSLDRLTELIMRSNHIFLSGAGRSGIVVNAFANRLMHLGFSVSVVGDITSPHSKPNDLLIICSGSGETESLVNLARKALDNDVKLVILTTNKNSSIASLANETVIIPGATKLSKDLINSLQPMGSSFEQLAFITFDSLVLSLMKKSGQNVEEMKSRHANFE